MNLWMVGELIEDGHGVFGITGVFDTEEKAVAECKTMNHFVGPLKLNRAVHEFREWPGAYRPNWG